MNKYCEYHESLIHNTDECIQLWDAIDKLINEGKLKKYVKNDQQSNEKRDY